jgi:hypothetical protein
MPVSTRDNRRPKKKTTTITIKQPVRESNWRDYGLGLLFVSVFAVPFLSPKTLLITGSPYTYIPTYWMLVILVVSFLGLLWLAGGILSQQTVPAKSWLLVFMGGLLLARLLSQIGSIHPEYGVWGTYGNYADGIAFIGAMLVWVWYFLSLRLAKDEIGWLVEVLMVQVGIFSVLTIKEAIVKDIFHKAVRTYTPLFNSDYYITYIVLFLPLILTLAYLAWRKKKNIYYRIWLTGLSLVAGISFFTSLPLEIQAHIVKSQTPTDSVAVATSNDFLSTPANSERFQQIRLGIQIGKEHLLTGSGAGTTRDAFYDHAATLPNWDFSHAMDNPHNDTVENFSEYGLIGIVTYLSFWVGFAYLLWRNRQRVDQELRPIAYSLAVGLFLCFVFLQFFFVITITGFVLWSVIALLAVLFGLYSDLTFKMKGVISTASVILTCASLYAVARFAPYYMAERSMVEAIAASQDAMKATTRDFTSAATLARQAVNLYPDQPFYHMFASNYSVMPVINNQIKNPYEASDIRSYALSQASMAALMDPHIPQYRLNEILFRYFFTVAGSKEEAKSQSDILNEVKNNPYDVTMYPRIANFYTTKCLKDADWANAEKRFQEVLSLSSPAGKSIIENSKTSSFDKARAELDKPKQ